MFTTPQIVLLDEGRSSPTRRQMTDAEKGAILVLHSLQYTVVMISHHVGRPWSTVKIFIVEPQREAQSTTYPDQDALLYYLVKIGGLFGVISKKDRTVTRQELRDIACPHVSLSTLDRYLAENGFRKWVAKTRPRLLEKHVKERLEWARRHQHWTVDNWRRVIWSDECSVQRAATGQRKWVFRTPIEKWYKDCIQPTQKGKDISLMVWGCFWGNNRGTFCPLIVKSVDSFIYRTLLRYLLEPVIESINIAMGPNMAIF